MKVGSLEPMREEDMDALTLGVLSDRADASSSDAAHNTGKRELEKSSTSAESSAGEAVPWGNAALWPAMSKLDALANEARFLEWKTRCHPER